MKEVILSAKNISQVFGKQHLVLDHLSLDIYKGDFTVIMGSSGAGKSTLLYALSMMDHVSQGQIIYQGHDLTQYNEKQKADIRKHDFGFVFQKPYLVSYLTLFENTLVSGYQTHQNQKEVYQKTQELFEYMHISHVQNHLPHEVSGGEAQRATIARALINQPDLLFADEPTGALNKANSEQVLDLLSSMHQNKQTILMVTHDIHAALRGNRILYLEDGKILGELNLSFYHCQDYQQRLETMRIWLNQMGW